LSRTVVNLPAGVRAKTFSSDGAGQRQSFALTGWHVDSVTINGRSVAGMPLQSLAKPQSSSACGQQCQFQYHCERNRAAHLPWRFAGTNIGSATGISYTRINAQFANAGSYDVIVTNSSVRSPAPWLP